ncbi:MAG: Rpn family recombination-promoting nuclease/putative transposase [Microcystis sp.]
MKTDTIFYQLLQTFPGLIFELLGESTQKAENYQFSSREIKELARRFDGIFLPTTAAPELIIYFVEVQFQDKSDFYWRFLTEIVIYLNQYKPVQDWIAVALFASRDLDNNFPYQLRGFEITGQIRRIYLDELIDNPAPSLGLGIIQLIVATPQLAQQRGKPLLEKAIAEIDDLVFQQKVVELIERTLAYKFTNLSRTELEAMFGLDDLRQTRLYQEAKEEGREEGREEAKTEAIASLLALGLSIEQIATALQLELTKVQETAAKLSPPN